MPAIYTTLSIYNSTETADLVDGTNYGLLEASFAPSVSSFVGGSLGGRSPYSNQNSRIVVNVRGTTGAIALANLAKLSRLLDTADRWSNGEDVPTTYLKLQPQGSTLADELEVVVLGRPDSGRKSALNLPVSFNDRLMVFEISRVTIEISHRGRLLNPTYETETTSSSTANNGPVVALSTFTDDVGVPAPFDLRMTCTLLNGINSGVLGFKGILGVAQAANKMIVLEAESGTLGTNWASAASTNASGSFVAELTPSTAITTGIGLNTTSLSTSTRSVAIFAKASGGTAVDYTLYAQMSGNNLGVRSRDVLIPSASGDKNIISFGVLDAFSDIDEITVYATPSTTGGSSDKLTIDAFLIVAVDDLASNALYIEGWGTTDETLVVSSGEYDSKFPIVYKSDGQEKPIDYRGNPYFNSIGDQIYCVFFGIDVANGEWRPTSQGASLAEIQFSADRYVAFLTPE